MDCGVEWISRTRQDACDDPGGACQRDTRLDRAAIERANGGWPESVLARLVACLHPRCSALARGSAVRLSARADFLSRALPSLANMASRGLGLVARLGLTIYMARYFSLPDIGRFGLIVGLAGLMPAVSGLGLNFFLSRDLVGKEQLEAGTLIRDRLFVTVVVTMLILAMTCVFLSARVASKIPVILTLLTAIIVLLETLAFDVHTSLISLRKSLLANQLLFIRSALWILPVIGTGVFLPHARNLIFLLGAWATGLLAYSLCLGVALRDWPWREILKPPVAFSHIGRIVRRGWLIYINDLGIAGSLYGDRYLIAHYLGLGEAGTFTLFWSIANGMHVLVTVAVVQVSLPDLVLAHRRSAQDWEAVLVKSLAVVLITGLGLSIAIFMTSEFILPLLGVDRLAGRPLVLGTMLMGMVLRLFGDVLNYGLYSRGLDKQLAVANILGLLILLSMDTLMIPVFGLAGAVATMVALPCFMIALRCFALVRAGVSLNRLARMVFKVPAVSQLP